MGICFSKCGRTEAQEDLASWLEVLENPEYLDWRRRRSGSATPFSQRHQNQIEQMQQTLPLRVDKNLWLSDTRSAKRLGRVKYLEITHILDLDGEAAPSREQNFATAGMKYKKVGAKNSEGYQILSKHLEETRSFIASARQAEGECLVFCGTGLDVSGVIVAAEIMLTNQTTVLEVVRELRQRRGNACLNNVSFQEQLVDLAQSKGLLGPEPGHPDSLVTGAMLERSRSRKLRKPGGTASFPTRAGASAPPSGGTNLSNGLSFASTKPNQSGSFGRQATPPLPDEDWPYAAAIRDESFLDWRTRADPDTGLAPDAAEQKRIEKEQGNMPVQISESVFLADARAARRIGRLKFIGITHVLNMAGPQAAPPSMEAFAEAHLLYHMIDAMDWPRYPVLKRHLREAQDFVSSARASGGRCLVYCTTGLSLSGVIVAADTMLNERLSLLEVVARCRRRRGNGFLPCYGFQAQLLDLARAHNLLGTKPDVPLPQGVTASRAGSNRWGGKAGPGSSASLRADVVSLRSSTGGGWNDPDRVAQRIGSGVMSSRGHERPFDSDRGQRRSVRVPSVQAGEHMLQGRHSRKRESEPHTEERNMLN